MVRSRTMMKMKKRTQNSTLYNKLDWEQVEGSMQVASSPHQVLWSFLILILLIVTNYTVCEGDFHHECPALETTSDNPADKKTKYGIWETL